MNDDTLIQIQDIGKSFPGVRALGDVSFGIKRGTVHCIIGENGAGKSTFIKILTGAIQRDGGSMILDGQPYDPQSVHDAMKRGISCLYQELNVVDDLTVRENLSLGKERNRFGFIQSETSEAKVQEVMKGLDPSIRLDARVASLSVAQKQIIEIVKAISTDCSVLVMDEPTAALSEDEVQRLFKVVRKLRAAGTTVIYISHKLSEIFEIGDYVTVFRDGSMIATKPLSEIESSCRDVPEACVELVKMMLGRVVTESYSEREACTENRILEVEGISTRLLKNVSFHLNAGEILGFYGLIGSGKTEVARAIYGLDAYQGHISLKGKKLAIKSPRDAIREGFSMVPEERRADGIFGKMPIKSNIPVMRMASVLKFGLIDSILENRVADDYMKRMSVRAVNREQKVASLSGGNQQKVVFAKCLNRAGKVYLLDEPTRGVDIGAKKEIHDLIRSLADSGAGVIVFTSELPEVVHLCDRIVLMHEGSVQSVVKNGPALDQDNIMAHVAGGGASL
jgi:ribose transport system ATP-binding protein